MAEVERLPNKSFLEGAIRELLQQRNYVLHGGRTHSHALLQAFGLTGCDEAADT